MLLSGTISSSLAEKTILSYSRLALIPNGRSMPADGCSFYIRFVTAEIFS